MSRFNAHELDLGRKSEAMENDVSRVGYDNEFLWVLTWIQKVTQSLLFVSGMDPRIECNKDSY